MKKKLKEKIKKITQPSGKSIEPELFDSCITLKNLALVCIEKPLSADFIYETLMENGGRLKPVYTEMLSLYRLGAGEKAFETFGKRIGTSSGKKFAAILSKIEKINPAELISQMEVFQNMMAEKRTTRAMAQVQRRSVLTTTWAAATIFALLINFVIVVVLLSTLNLLNNIF